MGKFWARVAKTLNMRQRDFAIVYGELDRAERLIVTEDLAYLQQRYEELRENPISLNQM
jgi:hypothetical protein